MAAKSRVEQAKKVFRDFDDFFHIMTGKRLKDVAKRGVDLYGEELVRKAGRLFAGAAEPEPSQDSPYTVLGVQPDAAEFVVKAAFRAAAREYHPDTGTKPDIAKFQAANQAYNSIIKEREARKKAKAAG